MCYLGTQGDSITNVVAIETFFLFAFLAPSIFFSYLKHRVSLALSIFFFLLKQLIYKYRSLQWKMEADFLTYLLY